MKNRNKIDNSNFIDQKDSTWKNSTVARAHQGSINSSKFHMQMIRRNCSIIPAGFFAGVITWFTPLPTRRNITTINTV